MAFPTAVTTFPNTSGTEVLGLLGSGTGLSPILNLMGVDLNAVETKLGSGAATPAANQLLVGTGAGTSAWQALTSAQLAAIISDETGSGLLVFGTSPVIVTPTIASFTNAQHNHANAAGGGQITGSTGIAAGTVTNALLDTAAGGIGAAFTSFAAVHTGFSVQPTTNITRYVQIGKVVTMICDFQGGTSNAGTWTFTLPVTAKATTNGFQGSLMWTIIDNSANITTPGRVFIDSSAPTVCNLDKSLIGTAWTSSGTKGVRFTITYEAA